MVVTMLMMAIFVTISTSGEVIVHAEIQNERQCDREASWVTFRYIKDK